MFHLLKLAIYALVGYALYEFAQGVIQENQGKVRGAVEESRPRRSPARPAGRR